ncbi:hypothetical protein IQ62_35970 [Streptomyces scabiei]|uniref:TULIP family P47-like protein n=1 Tax=Streptomyces scabiei TaxID=1930 RepID=UPI0004E79EB5|nr:TULIP family P47-like protein [Streptomyces scabiei]KFF96595.1 hypothetical protein IQ62_35970 [Streptomyces scabiei]
MDNSSLSRRGALAAAVGSAVTLAVPVAAHARPAMTDSAALGTINALLKSLPEGESLRLVIEDEKASPPKKGSPGKQPKLGDSYSTHGWDTVSAIRLTDVNRAIANAKVSPRKWSAKAESGVFKTRITAVGGFGVWATATGGSAEILCMEIPFDAALTVDRGDGKPRSVKITGGVATINLRLRYIAQGGPDKRNALMVSTEPLDKTTPAVTVEDVDYSDPAKDSQTTAWLLELLGNWFNQNLDQFKHVFATVSLGEDMTGDLSWLKPTATGYAYHDSTTLDGSVLGVLCMTENRDPVDIGADQLLDAGAIVPGQRAGLNISADRLMNKMLIPGLCAEYNTDPSSFTYHQETVTADKLNMGPISFAGSTYHPEITYFRADTSGGSLNLTISVNVDISPGVTVQFDTDYSLTPVLAAKDGKQYLTYQAKQVHTQSSSTVAWWVTFTEELAGLIVGIIFAGVGAMASMAERVGTVAVIGLVTEAVLTILEKIPEFIAGDIPDGLPSIDNLVEKTTSCLEWADAGEFQVQQVALNGALQLSGTCFG